MDESILEKGVAPAFMYLASILELKADVAGAYRKALLEAGFNEFFADNLAAQAIMHMDKVMHA